MDTQTVCLDGKTITLRQHPEVWPPLSAREMLQVCHAKGYLNNLQNDRVLDFAAGSGVLGLMLSRWGARSVTLTDYCPMAVALAMQRAEENGLDDVTGIHSDHFDAVSRQDYDLIISNPPVQPWLYTDVENQLKRDQAAWNEAGADGRLVLDSVLREAMDYLKVGGRLITSTSSRHGDRQTQVLLDQYWSGQWREFHRSEHKIIQDYHGPYLQTWLAMQVQDLDLRIYQKDQQGRPFAFYTDPEGEAYLLTSRGGGKSNILWQSHAGQWQAVLGSEDELPPLGDKDVQALQAEAQRSPWYYQYRLIEAIKTEPLAQVA